MAETGRERLYHVWKNFMYRCDKPTHKRYKNYGGRGITYSEDWKEFDNFYNWSLNNGYSDDLTLDRIDNDGNYEPSNCRWITNKAQQNNRTDSYKNVIINSEDKTVKEWCKIYGINYNTVITRMNVYDYPDIVTAITTPLKRKGGNGRGKNKSGESTKEEKLIKYNEVYRN